jgi:hypothetical protein
MTISGGHAKAFMRCSSASARKRRSDEKRNGRKLENAMQQKSRAQRRRQDHRRIDVQNAEQHGDDARGFLRPM